jgi:Tol biopolymer transport system component
MSPIVRQSLIKRPPTLARVRVAGTASRRGLRISHLLVLVFLSVMGRGHLADGRGLRSQSDKADKKSDKKADKKKEKVEPFKIRRLTEGLGLYDIGSLSPSAKSLALLVQKPGRTPNIYVLDVDSLKVGPPLTDLKSGASGPHWSPDGNRLVFAGHAESSAFDQIYTLELGRKAPVRMTNNNFSNSHPVFTPDGKRVLYATDESPLPDAAFGMLHVASLALDKGKPQFFTEEEVSSTLPTISSDGKSVLLVKVDEQSGRNSLWKYAADGKPLKSLTERRFARIHDYRESSSGEVIAIWGQEESEQQEDIYLLNEKTGEIRQLPDPDTPKAKPALSPDGKLLAFISPTDTGAQLFLFNSETGKIQSLTKPGPNTLAGIFISKTGIVFGSDRSGGSDLFLIDLSAPVE